MTLKLSGWGLVLLVALAVGVGGAGGRTLATTTVSVQVTGVGQVSGGTIACGDGETSCFISTTAAASVTLTATASTTGWHFDHWDGCPTPGPGADECTVSFDGIPHDVTANFLPSVSTTTFTLTVNVTGDSSGNGGNVSGGGINCDPGETDCTWDVYQGSTLTMVEDPDDGFDFSGWSAGTCSGTAVSCTFVMSSARTVKATFVSSPTTRTLTVSVTGNGTVTGGAIACGTGATTCTADVPSGSSVTLTATPASGASFTGWGGACSGTSPTCTVTMDAAKSVTAAFSGSGGGSSTVPLTVSITGDGTVKGGGIDCGGGAATCSVNATAGSTVTLTAAPGSGSTFEGWGGACSGSSATCTLTMSTARNVTATFAGETPSGKGATLTLTVAGRGTVAAVGGTCTSAGPTRTCRQSYDAGKTVELTAAPAARARFLGWGGACAGTARACSVTLEGDRTVTATFSGGSGAAALAALGRPHVTRTSGGFEVTLRFRSAGRGLAHLRALRAGRVETGLSFTVAPGPGTIGPLLVRKPGWYTFELRLGPGATEWHACLGRCGESAPGGPFTVTRMPATVVRAGEAWSVTIHFRSNRPAGADLRIRRGRLAVRGLRFAASAGEVDAGPFVLTPGSYALRLTVTDAYGRTRLLTWFAFLPG